MEHNKTIENQADPNGNENESKEKKCFRFVFSKWPFGVFISSKKPTKFLVFKIPVIKTEKDAEKMSKSHQFSMTFIVFLSF